VTNDVSVEAALVDLNIVAEGSAHRALDDARMTAEVLRSIHAELDLGLTQQYKDQFSNSKERRLIKNAVRSMIVQKKPQTWEAFVESYLAAKVPLTDPRKAAELKDYFHAELDKAAQKGN